MSSAFNSAEEAFDVIEGRIGSAASFRNVDNDTRLRRFTVLRRVWKLNAEEKTYITGLFMRVTTASRLMELLNEVHPWKDRIEYNSKLYDLELIEMSLNMLEEAAKVEKKQAVEDGTDPLTTDPLYLISARENSYHNFNVFLVKRLNTPAAHWVQVL